MIGSASTSWQFKFQPLLLKVNIIIYMNVQKKMFYGVRTLFKELNIDLRCITINYG